MKKLFVLLGAILVIQSSFPVLKAEITKNCMLGIDIISKDYFKKIGVPITSRIGLITNQTGKDMQGHSSLQNLLNKGFSVVALFAPEHGFHGQEAAGKYFGNSVHHHTKLPIYSLYREELEKIPATVFEKIDLFIFDIQDSGMRHYTYIATLLQALQLAVQKKKSIIVLDRPNPLEGRMEGPIAIKKNDSFLSSVPLPLRHGLTIGEIALFCNNYLLDKSVSLYVVPMQSYSRKNTVPEFCFKSLSPNIQTLDAIKGYSFLGLLGEIKPFDVGIGTHYAFQRFGLPKKCISKEQWIVLGQLLKQKGMNTKFIEYQRRKEHHFGFSIEIKDVQNFQAFNTLLLILEFCKKNRIKIVFSDTFNVAAGSEIVQNYVKNNVSKKELLKAVNNELTAFFDKAKTIFIYKPHPIIGVAALHAIN